MLDKKRFSYSSSKWVVKQWRQLTTSTHLAQKLLTNIQRSGGSRKFATEMRALKMSAVASHEKLTTNWEYHEADPFMTTWEAAEELNMDRSMVIPHLRQIGKAKKLSKWVSHELTTNQKNCHFEVLSSLILHNNKPFLNQIVTCNKKWIVYNNLQWPAQWLDQEAAPKHSTKPKLHQKKVMVTVWWSAAHLIHDSFLDPHKTITMEKDAQQTNETHRKLQHLQLAPVNWKGPILPDNTWLHVAQPILYLKVEWTGLRSFALSTIFTWPLAKLLPLFQASWQLFLQGKHFHNQQEAENAFQEFAESQSMDFYASGINQLISHWQKCVDCNGSYFD